MFTSCVERLEAFFVCFCDVKDSILRRHMVGQSLTRSRGHYTLIELYWVRGFIEDNPAYRNAGAEVVAYSRLRSFVNGGEAGTIDRLIFGKHGARYASRR